MYGQYYNNNLYFEYAIDLSQPLYHGSPYEYKWPKQSIYAVYSKRVAQWYGKYVYEIIMKPTAKLLDFSNALTRDKAEKAIYAAGMTAIQKNLKNRDAIYGNDGKGGRYLLEPAVIDNDSPKLSEKEKEEIVKTAVDLYMLEWMEDPSMGGHGRIMGKQNHQTDKFDDFVEMIRNEYNVSPDSYGGIRTAACRFKDSYDAIATTDQYGIITSYKNKKFVDKYEGINYPTLVINNPEAIASFKLIEENEEQDIKSMKKRVKAEGNDVYDIYRSYG